MTKNEEIVTSVVCEGCEMLSKDCFKSCSAFCSALKVANLKDEQLNQPQDKRRTIKFCIIGNVSERCSADSKLWLDFCIEPTIKEIFDKVEYYWGDNYKIETITRI